jgi:hypothetical protein
MNAMQQGRVPDDVQQRFEAAARDHFAAIRAAWAPEEFQKRAEEAFRTYVRELKEAWSQAGDEIDHSLLAEISQSVATAAQLAATAEMESQHRQAAVAQLAAAVPVATEQQEAGGRR